MVISKNLANVRRGLLLAAWLAAMTVYFLPGSTLAQVGNAGAADTTRADRLFGKGIAAFEEGTRESVDNAKRFFSESADLYVQNGNEQDAARAWSRLGVTYYQIGRDDSAYLYLRRALPIQRKTGTLAEVGQTLCDLAHVHNALNALVLDDSAHMDTMFHYAREALTYARKEQDQRLEGRALLLIGIAHVHRSRIDMIRNNRLGLLRGEAFDVDSALVYLIASRRVALAVSDSLDLGRTTYILASTLNLANNREAALVTYRKALEIAQHVGDLNRQGWVLYIMGAFYTNLGQVDSAFTYYSRALPVARQAPSRALEGSLLSGLASLYARIGWAGPALDHFRLALQAQQEIGSVAAIAKEYDNIGRTYMLLGRLEAAQWYLKRSRDTYKAYGNTSRAMAVSIGLNVLEGDFFNWYFERGWYKEATDRTRAHLEKGQANLLAGRASFLRFGKTSESLLEVLFEEKLDPNLPLPAPPAHAKFWGRLFDDVVNQARLYHVRAKKAHFQGDPASLRMAVANFDSSVALRTMIIAHAGEDANRVRFAERDPELYGLWVKSWLDLADDIGEREAALASLAAMERGRAQALTIVTGTSSDTYQRPGADLLAEGALLVEQSRALGATVLTYALTNDALIIWVIQPSGKLHVVRRSLRSPSLVRYYASKKDSLQAQRSQRREDERMKPVFDVQRAAGMVETKELQEAIGSIANFELNLFRKSARDTLLGVVYAARVAIGDTAGAATIRGLEYGGNYEKYDDEEVDWLDRASQLVLGEEVLQHLPASGEIVIVPHGVLGVLPFAALPVGPDGEPFGVKYALRYAPSLRILVEKEKQPSTLPPKGEPVPDALVVGYGEGVNRTTVWGDSIRVNSSEELERQARWLAGRLGAKPHLGPDALETDVKRLLATAPLVHFATHGKAQTSMVRLKDSWLLLQPGKGNDGLLTAGEVLETLPPMSAELVTLSACQTGFGDVNQVEGVIGLQRAFLAKGARSVLATLWEVPADGADTLMRKFYTYWRFSDEPVSKAEALRKAQEEVRGIFDKDPLYWAAFQLIGAN